MQIRDITHLNYVYLTMRAPVSQRVMINCVIDINRSSMAKLAINRKPLKV